MNNKQKVLIRAIAADYQRKAGDLCQKARYAMSESLRLNTEADRFFKESEEADMISDALYSAVETPKVKG